MKRTPEYQEKWACVALLSRNVQVRFWLRFFSKSDKVTHGVIPKIYKESLNVYESSDENMLRSIAVYYSGGRPHFP